MDQKIRFCTTPDGTRICYATVGEGPVLVKAPNWLSHIEYELSSPVWNHWWQALAEDFRFIRFDQRGSGLSDRSVTEQSFDAWVNDLETVVEASGVDRLALLGISQGGAVALAYAVRHPERVSHVILCNSYARGWLARGGSEEEHAARLILTRQGWGRDNPAYRQMFTSQFMPGATLEQMDWFNELQRISTSPENATRVQEAFSNIDVIDLLPQVSAPTLIFHSRDDAQVPFEQGRELAMLIPNAKFVPLDSKNHLLIESEPAWQTVLSEVRSFLGVEAQPPAKATSRSDAYPAGLTAREVEVLRLIVDGNTNPQIARELFISVKTVGNHVSHILNKTNTSNRSQAAAYAVRQGIT